MKPTRSNPRNLTRRDALTIFGATAVGGGLLGCTSDSASPQGTGTGGAGGDPQTGPGNISCVLTPESTEGPFFVDEKLNRADLTANETDPAVLGGYPLALNFTIMAIGSGACQPLAGAFVDIWHANVNGLYSDEAPTMFQMTDTSGVKYLRGYQVTNGAGAVAFKTIYPGWYLTRTVHIHFKIRLFAAAGNKTFETSGQMYFDDAMNDTIFSQSPYVGRGARTIPKNTNDQVFNGTGPGSGIDTVGLPPGQVPPGQKTIASTTPAILGPGHTASLKIGLKIA
jgi:protocatechuate 3,4-dioxygenase beta subunit